MFNQLKDRDVRQRAMNEETEKTLANYDEYIDDLNSKLNEKTNELDARVQEIQQE